MEQLADTKRLLSLSSGLFGLFADSGKQLADLGAHRSAGPDRNWPLQVEPATRQPGSGNEVSKRSSKISLVNGKSSR